MMKRTQPARWGSFVFLLAMGGFAACAEGSEPLPSGGQVDITNAALTASTTIKRGGGGTVADATIKAQHLRQNFGADAKLIVSKKNEALLRFDVSAIPPSAVINSATLTLYMHGHADGDDDHDCDDDWRDEDRRGFSSVPIGIHLATAGWMENKVTYANFNQAFTPAAAGILLPAGKNTYKSIDLKAAVQSWVGGERPNYGVVLRTTSRKRWAFASSENKRQALRPSLTISYSTPDEHCVPNPCLNGGSCTNDWTGYTCTCAPGFTGATCETNIDECAGDPCLNGGTCADDVNGYTCSCAAGYGGAHCETNIDECAPNPCQHGGVCTDGVNAYACACAIGYTGEDCETLVDECESEPCQNGGTCTNGIGTYTCACLDGFTGTNCETNVDDCADAPCLNGGACDDGVNSYVCNCAAGFSGENCETNVDECAGEPCQNGGTCIDGVDGYACACQAGFTGVNCEINIDDCASSPCQNGGVCVDGDASYTCACAAGYTGTSCETDIDDCTPNPCQNGGGCNDGVNSHSCDCPPGFTGANCETPVACTDPSAATVVATRGDTTAPTGYAYRQPQSATATSVNECPEWSCGVGTGPAANAIDDIGSTGWSSGSWDFGTGYTLTVTFDTPQTLHGLHIIAEGWPDDVQTYTVTGTTSDGVAIPMGSASATIFDWRPADDQTGVDVGFTATGYADVKSVAIVVSAPFESPALSTWIDIREVQLIQPVTCAAAPTCPAGSSTFQGACYAWGSLPAAFPFVTGPDGRTNYWLTGDAYCASTFGGHLTSVHSAAEQAFVFGLAGGGMIGFSDQGRAVNDFAWFDGTAVDFTAWGASEPSNNFTARGTEDCVQLTPGGWNDLPCTDGGYYICKFAP